MVVIDFISCTKSFQSQILSLMKELCDRERIPTKVWGWTRAKNFEIEREYHKTPDQINFRPLALQPKESKLKSINLIVLNLTIFSMQ